MGLAIVGLSHRTAPLDVRERLVFSPEEIPGALARIVESPSILEAALLSTCNRTEICIQTVEGNDGTDLAVQVLDAKAGEPSGGLDDYLYVYRDREMVRHLYRVISGLDSMVLGEVEVQGQVKAAYEIARKVTGPPPAIDRVFNRLFQSAISAGGRVRSETGISEGAASVPSVAVELAEKIFGSLEGRRGMVLGAGEMGELTLRCLVDRGMESVIVANRTFDRAEEIARNFGGRALPYGEFWDWLPETDIVISSTAAPHPVVTHEQFRRRLPRGPRSPLFIVDIAIPRDVEAAVGDQPNVFLYTIDDLEGIVTANFERRQAEIPSAESIIEESTESFWRWYTSLRAVPMIRRVRNHAERLRRAELERSLSEFRHLPDEDLERIDRLTRDLLNKFLHHPTARLREAAADGREQEILAAAEYLFELDVEGDDGRES